MAGEWQTLTLREAGVSLIDCDHRTPPSAEKGYPYVAIPQLRGGRIDLSDVRRITHEHFIEWTRKAMPQENDIVLSRRCNPGETAYVPAGLEFALGQNLVLLRADGACIHPPFLRWLTRSPDWWLQVDKFLNVGAVFDSLRCADVPCFELKIPPQSEQRAIAHILGTLDDKIELNRKMNETLEAMVRALFKSWFVDFDPVRAKAAGRDTGLPKSVADLFPDSFADSELGEIPRGWKAVSLSYFATLNPESWTRETRPAVIEYVDLSNTKWGRIDAVTRYTQEEAPSRAQRVLRPLDTIVGTVRPGNGSYAFILIEGLTGSTGFAVLRPTKREYAEHVYLAASAPENIEHLAQLADGAAYPAVRPEVVAATRVVKPDDKAIKGFADIVTTIMANIAANEAETSTLAALRDTLLPKLVSGALRIENSDRISREEPNDC
ncbi:MAG: Type I restriction-modification system, specificity subunit S [Nitrospira sp.]|nr:MAG: Type I restriction-modification system, specificity subunit S [Nitrospira sp.]